ncbi:OLC1v1016466C2 [Oldenlandia corymbosa var. corymbosa]|uniref:OLC1v1016466C2 n=1 Tax=Oldenlandia corymbosa var. corymbosa TaxID=529605 RepID=A0AAV1E606_OLDCO|nr:OLC1v1016466C2 [Oldenlandia corymbosa var. corymbosa]
MKMTWKNPGKNKTKKLPLTQLKHLPFDQQESPDNIRDDSTTINSSGKDAIGGKDEPMVDAVVIPEEDADHKKLSRMFEEQGNKLAENGHFREALGKWESAITLTPERAVLHEQKAQVLLELGETWSSVKAATRATELEATWAEAWITLGRAQLNFGEPDSAIESFDRALAIKPDSEEALDDRKTAGNLIKKRKQLHSGGLSISNNRFAVGENGNGP